MRELLLAAAGPGRIAFDDDFDGAPQGVLTHYALQAMNEARYDLTYEQLLQRLIALIPRAFDQVPLLEGAGKGRTVFYLAGIRATASTSILIPGIASRLTSTSVLAGRVSPKNSLRTGLIAGRSSTSVR